MIHQGNGENQLQARDGPIDDCLSIRNGRLTIEGCDAVSLAEQFGTPLYVISEDPLRRNVRTFYSEFRQRWTEGPVVVMPSIKANFVLALRRILNEEGAGCDTFGRGELHAALLTGVQPDLISFNGSSKTAALLERAIGAGARITLDAAREVELVIAAAKKVGQLARVRVGVRPDLDVDTPSDFYAEPISVREAARHYKPGIPTDTPRCWPERCATSWPPSACRRRAGWRLSRGARCTATQGFTSRR